MYKLVSRFNVALEEFSLDKVGEDGKCYPASVSSQNKWRPPPLGWIKVNVDAAYLEKGSAAAMVVRKDDGKLLFLSSTVNSCRNPLEAELEALNWAASFAEEGNWKQVCWEVDALEVVKAIKSAEEPTNWYAFYRVLELRKRFGRSDWDLNWQSRICNSVADLLAKHSLSFGVCLFGDEYSVESIPPAILDLISAEQAFAALKEDKSTMQEKMKSKDVSKLLFLVKPSARILVVLLCKHEFDARYQKPEDRLYIAQLYCPLIGEANSYLSCQVFHAYNSFIFPVGDLRKYSHYIPTKILDKMPVFYNRNAVEKREVLNILQIVRCILYHRKPADGMLMDRSSRSPVGDGPASSKYSDRLSPAINNSELLEENSSDYVSLQILEITKKFSIMSASSSIATVYGKLDCITAIFMSFFSRNQSLAFLKAFIPVFNNVFILHGTTLMARENDRFLRQLLHLCDAHQQMHSWAESAQSAVAVAGVVMQALVAQNDDSMQVKADELQPGVCYLQITAVDPLMEDEDLGSRRERIFSFLLKVYVHVSLTVSCLIPQLQRTAKLKVDFLPVVNATGMIEARTAALQNELEEPRSSDGDQLRRYRSLQRILQGSVAAQVVNSEVLSLCTAFMSGEPATRLRSRELQQLIASLLEFMAICKRAIQIFGGGLLEMMRHLSFLTGAKTAVDAAIEAALCVKRSVQLMKRFLLKRRVQNVVDDLHLPWMMMVPAMVVTRSPGLRSQLPEDEEFVAKAYHSEEEKHLNFSGRPCCELCRGNILVPLIVFSFWRLFGIDTPLGDDIRPGDGMNDAPLAKKGVGRNYKFLELQQLRVCSKIAASVPKLRIKVPLAAPAPSTAPSLHL
ncbi:hypothetical protein FNV43_RR19464 [Rhamnella rubrinervis]|uniref:RNase H type-1 domain-containing protein n=1 Tax=Rhamnella rubrinervis TaxID=2594499 RepID=A0A8K0E4J2_9ROSA|nr:hypothetical protein FNV43_RR19464 [Rhamnella rubrinervis]